MNVGAMLSMLFAVSGSDPSQLARMTTAECPVPQPDAQRGYLGDRAIIADDGSKLVVQCGDGTIRLWKRGSEGFQAIGKSTLFRAAQSHGIVPKYIQCSWAPSIRDSMHFEPDCDVMDHDTARSSYVLSDDGGIDTFVSNRVGVIHETDPGSQTGGALSREKPAADSEFIVEAQKRPELLQKVDIKSAQATTIAVLPNPNLLVEDGEGRASGIAYSAAYKLVIVSFGGAFRIARGMTCVRAFDESGRQRWSIRAAIPNPDDESIVGDFTRLLAFEGGRYALLAKSSDKSVSQIINLKNGQAVGTVRGWPIAAARDRAICLVKDENGVLTLVKITQSEKAAR